MDDDFPTGSDDEKKSINDINSALESLRRATVAERKKGIDHLERIFTFNSRRSKDSRLKDASYLWLLQQLFQLVKNETPSYARNINKPSARSKSASILSTYAAAIRSTVEHGARVIRKKTVKAVIDHIIQTLPTASEPYCEPLVSDYLKSLRAILGWLPHVEHLPGERWSHLVGFCIEGIQHAVSSSEESSSISRVNGPAIHDTLPSRSSTPGTLSTSRDQSFRSRQFLSQNEKSFGSKNLLEDWGACLACLYSTTNAPILKDPGPTFAAITSLLYSSSPSSISQRDIFKPVNSILARSMLQDIELTCSILRETVPLISRHWQCRSSVGREEMLVTLVYGQPYFPRLLQVDNSDEGFEHDFRILLETVQEEYHKRSERDQLQVDDLELYENGDDIPSAIPLRLRSVALRSGSLKAEQSWAVLEFVAFGLYALQRKTARGVPEEDGMDPPPKRRKVSTPIGTMLHQLRHANNNENISQLQIIAFAIEQNVSDLDDVQTILEQISPLISSENAYINNWSMLVASWYVSLESLNEKIVLISSVALHVPKPLSPVQDSIPGSKSGVSQRETLLRSLFLVCLATCLLPCYRKNWSQQMR